jgi:leucyl-tRNA synthetase
LSAGEQHAVIDGHRLAYLADGPVNWCPGLGTVLANEEVTADGRSDIGNFPVFRRTLRQWMLRITAYADRLLDDLDALEWPESIKTMQRNWIGRSDGARIRFPTSAGPIELFTTRPDTVFGATFMVLAPEHPLVDALLPPIWPASVPQSWRVGADSPAEAVAGYRHAAAAKTDRERQESRAKNGVAIGAVATNPATGASIQVFVADYVLMGYGTGAIMGVPGQALDPDDETSEPVPPLALGGDWVTVELDLGDGPRRHRRELNVMPQWAGSCWYELRYLDPINEAAFCDPEVERYWMGPRNPGDPGGVDPVRWVA